MVLGEAEFKKLTGQGGEGAKCERAAELHPGSSAPAAALGVAGTAASVASWLPRLRASKARTMTQGHK